MKRTRYVIVGGSAAGMAAAEVIRRHDPHGAVSVLSQEEDAPYFRPMIPFNIYLFLWREKYKMIKAAAMAGINPNAIRTPKMATA